MQIIRQTIVNSNKLLAAYIADLYYLNLDPYYQLRLPKMSDKFNQEGLDKEVLNTYLSQLQGIQQQEQQIYEQELKRLANEIEIEKVIEPADATDKMEIEELPNVDPMIPFYPPTPITDWFLKYIYKL